MKIFTPGLVILWLISSALMIGFAGARAAVTDGASSSAPPLQLLHTGYAFDHPRVLVQQRLFGLAHGVTLLAAACVEEPAYREPITLAYTEWKEQQASTIDASTDDLARYYFGHRAIEATRLDVVRALKLEDRLTLKPESKDLHAACDSFIESVRKPRYDLRQQFQLQLLASRLAEASATEARIDACRASLAARESAELDKAVAQWRQTFDTGVALAKATIEQRWSNSQLDGTFDEWLAQSRDQGKRSAVAERCKNMSQWLLTNRANPDDAFDRAP